MDHLTFPHVRKITAIIHRVIIRINLYRLRLSFHPIITLILLFILLIILILLQSAHFIIQLITNFDHIPRPIFLPLVIHLPFIIDHLPNYSHLQSVTIKLILLINSIPISLFPIFTSTSLKVLAYADRQALNSAVNLDFYTHASCSEAMTSIIYHILHLELFAFLYIIRFDCTLPLLFVYFYIIFI